MAPARRRRRRWADLPPELIETILRRLTLDDYLPFGIVCKSWRSAMINARSLFKPPPILILKAGSCSFSLLHLHHDRFSRASDAQGTRFYSICGGGGEHRSLPTIRPINPFKNRPKRARCFGSSMGWLFMMDVDDGSRLHLLNPTSDEEVALPALPPYIELWNSDDALCSKPASDQGCIVVVEGTMTDARATTVLLTCCPKDADGWKEIRYRRRHGLYTFALYEGRLYVIAGQKMVVYDFDPDPRKIGSVVIDDGIHNDHMLLAVVDGKLLLVFRSLTGPRLVYEFVVDRWAKIQSIGDWVLLMHEKTSQAFSTKEYPTLGFRANCICQQSDDSIVVYSMEDESSMTILPPKLEAGSKIIRSPYHAGYSFQAFWVLAQSWQNIEVLKAMSSSSSIPRESITVALKMHA